MVEFPGLRLVSRTSEETSGIGACLGRELLPGDVVALSGELGTGKTCLVKGLARGLDVDEESNVRSPSFVILNIYAGRHPFYHFDFYRISHPAEVEDLGTREILYGDGVTAIEWADKMVSLLPEERIEIDLRFLGETRRELLIRARGKRYRSRWPEWQAGLERFT